MPLSRLWEAYGNFARQALTSIVNAIKNASQFALNSPLSFYFERLSEKDDMKEDIQKLFESLLTTINQDWLVEGVISSLVATAMCWIVGLFMLRKTNVRASTPQKKDVSQPPQQIWDNTNTVNVNIGTAPNQTLPELKILRATAADRREYDPEYADLERIIRRYIHDKRQLDDGSNSTFIYDFDENDDDLLIDAMMLSILIVGIYFIFLFSSQ